MEYNYIKDILNVEKKFVLSEHKFHRTGNTKFARTNDNLSKNEILKSFIDCMNVSTSFSMLMTSKRINIYSLCNEIIELIEKKDTLLLTLTLRTLIERISIFYYYYRQTINFPISKEISNENLNYLDENLLPKLARGLFQTGLDMNHLSSEVDIRKIDLKPYEFKDGDRFDRSTLNILTPINQFDKKIRGIKNAYSLLSEMLHPNYGDLEHSSSSMNIYEQEQILMIQRVMKKNYEITDLWKNFLNQIISIVNDSCELYLKIIPNVEKYLLNLNKFSRSFIHSEMKIKGLNFFKLRKGSMCPCQSGLRVKDCHDFI